MGNRRISLLWSIPNKIQKYFLFLNILISDLASLGYDLTTAVNRQTDNTFNCYDSRVDWCTRYTLEAIVKPATMPRIQKPLL